MVHLLPLKRHMMIRKRNMECNFYNQDFSGFIPFFGRGFIGKRVSLFI